MTVSSSTTFPLHPAYQEIARQYKATTEEVFKKFVTGTEEEKLATINQIRANSNLIASKLVLPETIRTEKEVSGGPDNVKVKTTICRPVGSENEVLPVLIYCHGGGWVFGSPASHAKVITDLCIKTHIVVMALDYSLSPEAQYPVANEEAYAALCWLREHGKSININPDKVAIGGDSAGGNMSAVVALMAKDRGMPDALKAQVLYYPSTGNANSTPYPSHGLFGQGDVPLSNSATKLFLGAYLAEELHGTKDPFCMPMHATDEQLQGLPAALLLTAECDVLRDEGEAYQARLLANGVYTSGFRVLGTTHGYLTAPIPETPQYRTTVQATAAFLKDQFETSK